MENLLDGLTEQQRLAVTVHAPRLRILAGAGSGKTRVLTRRIAHGARARTLDPAHTLALTFTRKAAGELRHRLRALGLHDDTAAGTFHAQAYAQLRARWADNGVRPPELLDRRGRVLFRVLPQTMSRAERLGILAEIDWASARRIEPDRYPEAAERADRRAPVPVAQVAAHYRDFADEKRRRRMVDFDDLLELAIRDMSDSDYARTRHWRYRHLFVDEFQDVNPLQFDLLRAWLGPECTLCVVGDPNQAIYAWNGADATYLTEFETRFPHSETVRLTHNFRSTPQIVDAAARVLPAGALEANRPPGRSPTVQACVSDVDEAVTVARAVRDAHRPGSSWSRQAILVRTNAQTTLIADALNKAGIPVAIKAGASILDNPTVADRVHELGATPIPLATALSDLRLDARAASDDQVGEALDALANLADDHLSVSADATSVDFVAWARATVGADSTPAARDAVDLVTFHASKGLEWPVVHLAGLEAGYVPIGQATTQAAADEEVRLFYVAITRAQDEVHCTWAATRRFGERVVDRRISPLLERMNAVPSTATPTVAPQSNAQRVRQLRATLGVADLDDGPPPLVDRIRQWRLETARAAGVPAYVVFGDRTLDALAAARPRTSHELADIPGLGPVKIARYGDALLAVVNASD